MIRELRAITEPGRRLVELAETLGDELALRAGEHDADGSYPYEAIDTLKDKRYMWAPVPEEHGGLGVRSAHDLLVASSRLARGDASVAIGVNMQLVLLDNLTREWERSVARGRPSQARAAQIRSIVDAGVVIAAAVSEPGQDLSRPATTAVRIGERWRVDGRKIFCTMSPAADVLSVAVTVPAEHASIGEDEYAFAIVPTSAPGVTIHGDWDAMGMRASGSHSVSLTDVRLPAGSVRGGFLASTSSVELLERYLLSGLFHAAATLGIAEFAHHYALDAVRARYTDGALGSRVETLVAESTVELGAMRSMLSAAGVEVDEYNAGHSGDVTFDHAAATYASVQSAKAFIDRTAIRVVDRALELVGGAGYLRTHPLERAYRDVRAGAFMHPLGANRAWDYIAAVALGRLPAIS